MVNNNELRTEIDNRIRIIDNKLKQAFSLVKRDITDIKSKANVKRPAQKARIPAKLNKVILQLKKSQKNNEKAIRTIKNNKKQQEKMRKYYESRLEEMKLQNTLDRAASEARIAQNIGELRTEQENISDKLFVINKVLQSKKK